MPRQPSIRSTVENLFCDSILCKPISVDWEELQRDDSGEPGFEVILPSTFDEDDQEAGDYSPTMNYAYPLGRNDSFGAEDADKIKDLPLVLIEMGGDYYLALTGGGMDFSWEICAGYVRLGFCPPFHFASGLPKMAQNADRDMRLVIAGAKKTMNALENWVRNGRDDIRGLEKWYREQAKKHKAA
jgi:hypothetical protein